MKAKIVAKTVVLNDRDEVLLLRRSATDTRRPGEWDFPGGGIEPGEDLAEGAAREIAEESGLTIEPTQLKLIYAATELFPGRESVTRLLFASRIETGDVQLSFEHDEFRWVDIETALTEFPHPFYGAGLKYARDNELL